MKRKKGVTLYVSDSVKSLLNWNREIWEIAEAR
jgi:hypothetical protein